MDPVTTYTVPALREIVIGFGATPASRACADASLKRHGDGAELLTIRAPRWRMAFGGSLEPMTRLLQVTGIAAALFVVVAALVWLVDETPSNIDGDAQLPGLGLRDGDCFNLWSSAAAASHAVVPCSEPHNSQVVSTKFNSHDTEFEGALEGAMGGCITDADTFAGGSLLGSQLVADVYGPSEIDWAASDKTVYCIARSLFGDITYDLENTLR